MWISRGWVQRAVPLDDHLGDVRPRERPVAVATDPVAIEFEHPAAHHAGDAGLDGRVVALPARAGGRRARDHVEDVSARLLHRERGRLAASPFAKEVHRDDLVELLLAHAHQGPIADGTRVVEHYFDSAVLPAAAVHQALCGRVVDRRTDLGGDPTLLCGRSVRLSRPTSLRRCRSRRAARPARRGLPRMHDRGRAKRRSPRSAYRRPSPPCRPPPARIRYPVAPTRRARENSRTRDRFECIDPLDDGFPYPAMPRRRAGCALARRHRPGAWRFSRAWVKAREVMTREVMMQEEETQEVEKRGARA